MFHKESGRASSDASETIIGPAVKVEGDLKGVGSVIIEGILKGSISTDKNVSIGEKAEIEADITANNATVAGTINGSIKVSSHLEVKASANIQGDISTKTIAIESGARINGRLTMGGESAQSTMPTPEAEDAPESDEE